jgi:hypothetical protein
VRAPVPERSALIGFRNMVGEGRWVCGVWWSVMSGVGYWGPTEKEVIRVSSRFGVQGWRLLTPKSGHPRRARPRGR